jgi:hypothetical protein
MEFAANKNEAYSHLDGRKTAKERNGTQAGDPAKGARAMYDLAVQADPPLRCIIGSDAFKVMETKIKTMQETHERNKEISNSTDVEEK